MGDRRAVDECVDRYGKLVWHLARRFIRDRAEAEDAVQDVFIDVWKNASRFDSSKASESTFISVIARRRLIDKVRSRQRQPETQDIETTEVPQPAEIQEQLETKDDAGRAAQVLASLRPERQHVLKLSIFHDWTHGQIAEALGLPLGTVKSHVRRGLIELREKLGAGGMGEQRVAP